MTTTINRRNFLKTSLGAMGGALLSQGIAPDFVYAEAPALNTPPLFIVQLFLPGGMDALRAFPPAGSLASTYVDISRGIRTNGGIAEDPATHVQFGAFSNLHPSWAPLQPIINAGHLGLLHRCSVGLNNPTFGHESEQLTTFNLGRLSNSELNSRQGWANALLEKASNVCNVWGMNVGNQESLQGPYVGEVPISVSNLGAYGFTNRSNALGGSNDSTLARELAGNMLIASAPQSEAQIRAQSSIQAARGAVADVQRINSINLNAFNFPGGFGQTMLNVAKIFADGAASNSQHQIVLVQRGGFDTHNQQTQSFGAMLDDISRGILALYNFMASQNLLSRFVLITGSDFGRTSFANTSLGTDHAWGTINMVISGALGIREFGDALTDADLRNNRNYIVPTLDMRNAYWELFAKMGLDPAQIMRYQNFTRRNIGLFR